MSAHYIHQPAGHYMPLGATSKTGQDGLQRTNRDGIPQWTIQVLHQGHGKADIISVTVASKEPPAVAPMQPAVFEGLRVDHYSMAGGASGLFFVADAVRPVEGGQK